MKHASERTLEVLAPLLAQLRTLPTLDEKKLGVFYRRSKAFLHFHEDSTGIYADVRLGTPDFERLPVSSVAGQRELLRRIRGYLS
jgi:hypothetical protein